MATFADRIKGLREEHHLTQQELASRVGTTKSAISMYERGERRPSFEVADALTDFFDVSIAYLNGSSDERGQYPRHNRITVPLTAEEHSVLLAYQAASEEIRAAVRAVLGIK